MKIVIPRKRLAALVTYAASSISGRTTLPILSHVKLVASGSKLTATGTDLELWTEVTGDCALFPDIDDAPEAGSLTLPSRHLLSLVSSLPDGDVTISHTTGTNKTLLTAGRSKYELMGLPAEEFPAAAETLKPALRTIGCKLLKDLLRGTTFAVSTDETRVVLMGIYLESTRESGKPSMRFSATDTHRLATAKAVHWTPGAGDTDDETKAIIPARACQSLVSNLPDDGDVQLTITDGMVTTSFVKGKDSEALTYSFGSRLIQGLFPNYQRVIPTRTDKELLLERGDLVGCLKRISNVAQDNANRVVLATEGATIVLSSEAGTVGSAREELEVGRKGDDITIAFNNKYLLDALGAISTEGVKLELAEPLRPGIVRPVDDYDAAIDWLCVLMPMQVV